MTKVTYEVVEHDGGWAYRVNGTFSETFATRRMARRAAGLAAQEQREPGSGGDITYEDEEGNWWQEDVAGDDRPETAVND